MDIPLHVAGITVTITPTINPLTGIVSVAVPARALPAGRTFRSVVTISATPVDIMPSPTTAQVDGNTPPAATYTYRFHVPLDTTGVVNALVLIEEQINGVWVVYDSALWSQAIPQAPGVLAVAARPKFGVNTHVFIPKLRAAGSMTPMLNKAKDPNVKLYRASAPWSYMAPTSAAFDATAQGQCDAFADWLRANQGKWVVSLHAIPAAWAATGGDLGAHPANWADYDTFIDTFLARYGDVIEIVENVNEPNSSTPYVGQHGRTWADFAITQQHLYNRTKAYNPAIQVAGPALAYGDATYLDTMYQQGFGPYMDLINVHPYNIRWDVTGTAGATGNNAGITGDPLVGWKDEAGKPNDFLNGIQAIYEVMAAHGDGGKKILVGEWGVATSFTGLNKSQSTLDASLADQSKQLVTTVRQAMRDSRIYAYLVYMIYDNAADTNGIVPFDIKNWQHNFGLTSSFGDIDKPSLAAFKAAIANPT